MSLATKYRPQSLDNVIGQPPVIKALKRALGRPVAPKSYLFTGPAGTGKTTLARLLAAHFCGGVATPANIIAVDAATTSGVEATRAVASQAHYKAIGLSPVKTIIVDECHRLSGTAWDSLLLPIEEPPAHVYWVLCSTNPAKIPETIKTRCVTYVLKPVDDVSLFELLDKVVKAENLTTNDEVLEAIIDQANGSPRQALTDLELCAHAKSGNEARALMQSALQQKGPVDLARLLLARTPPQWPTITKTIGAIENADAESIRIVIANYVAGALAKAKSNTEATHLLRILDCFSTPYNQSDKLAPLYISMGLALGLDQ